MINDNSFGNFDERSCNILILLLKLLTYCIKPKPICHWIITVIIIYTSFFIKFK